MKQHLWKITNEGSDNWALIEVGLASTPIGNVAVRVLDGLLGQVATQAANQRLRIISVTPTPDNGLLFVLEPVPAVAGIT